MKLFISVANLSLIFWGVKSNFKIIKVHIQDDKKKLTLTIQIAPSLHSTRILNVYGRSISFVKPVRQISDGYITKVVMQRTVPVVDKNISSFYY